MFEQDNNIHKPEQKTAKIEHTKGLSINSVEQLEEKILLKSNFYFFIHETTEDVISDISLSIKDIHGLNPKTCAFSDLIKRIHPEDLSHYTLSSKIRGDFFQTKNSIPKISQFNHSIFFRIKVRSGDYKIINQQSLPIEISDCGLIEKSLIIHTVLDEILPSKMNMLKLILQQEKPKLNGLNLLSQRIHTFSISKRELEIIQLIYAGFENLEISKKLFISLNTVKKHRSNILKKAFCSNTAQLLNKCISEGIL